LFISQTWANNYLSLKLKEIMTSHINWPGLLLSLQIDSNEDMLCCIWSVPCSSIQNSTQQLIDTPSSVQTR
jgi:hypothetical protein